MLIYSQEKWSDKADATIKTKSAGILGIAQNNQKLMDAGIEKVEGNSDIIKNPYIKRLPNSRCISILLNPN